MPRVLAASLVLGVLLAACSSSSSGGTDATAGAGGVGVGGAGPGAGGAGAPGAGAPGAGAPGAGAPGAGGVSAAGLPCEVNQLLVSRCQQCHSDPPQFGAPMPLVTRAHLLALTPTDPSTTVAARSITRMKDDKNPMPQPPNARASAGELAALEAWVSAGMPESDGQCSAAGGAAGAAGAGTAGTGTAGTGTAGAAGGTVASCTPDQVVKASKPWTIKQSTADEYVCFGGKIKASDKKRHITEVSVNIDNKTHAHHLCIYDLGTNAVPTEPETCQGGSAIAQGKLLYCWAPGADAETLPPEAGFPLAAGQDTNILIEMHYSNIQGLPDSLDNSAATFCTTDQLRPNDADVMAFGSSDFSLPPHQQTTVENTFTVPAGLLQEGSIRVVRGWPHMHLLGAGQSTVVTRDGVQMADLGSTDNYSFQNQIGYPIDATIQAKDKITTRCFFNNNTDNVVKYGENTAAEMCYNFVTYYPRITSKQWVWAAPGYIGKTSVYPTK